MVEANHGEPGGRLMIFGRPTHIGASSPETHYAQLYGVDEVHSLDISPYEGATFIHDLNNPELPHFLRERYRAVSFGGSVQFIFDIGSVLRASADLLEVGGLVFCGAPSNNRQQNAYYQLCPTLKFDFFEANGFELGASTATFNAEELGIAMRRQAPVYPGEASHLDFVAARVSHLLVAKKLATSTSDKTPINSTYRFRQTREQIRWRFRATIPCDLEGGRKTHPPMRRFRMPSDALRRHGKAWLFPFEEQAWPPSLPSRPFRSRALVFEDGGLLPWIVADRTMVHEKPGSFGHFGPGIAFSPSDGSDPTTNGRSYEVCFPQPFDGMRPYASDPLYPDRLDLPEQRNRSSYR